MIGLNITKRNPTPLDTRLNNVMYKSLFLIEIYNIYMLQCNGNIIMMRFAINCCYIELCDFESLQWPNPTRLICWIMKTGSDRYTELWKSGSTDI